MTWQNQMSPKNAQLSNFPIKANIKWNKIVGWIVDCKAKDNIIKYQIEDESRGWDVSYLLPPTTEHSGWERQGRPLTSPAPLASRCLVAQDETGLNRNRAQSEWTFQMALHSGRVQGVTWSFLREARRIWSFHLRSRIFKIVKSCCPDYAGKL